MHINEAVSKAIEIDGYITEGVKDMKSRIFIKPTNRLDCCIVCVTPEYSKKRWNPRANDLISDSWEVVTEEDFLSLSKQNKFA